MKCVSLPLGTLCMYDSLMISKWRGFKSAESFSLIEFSMGFMMFAEDILAETWDGIILTSLESRANMLQLQNISV